MHKQNGVIMKLVTKEIKTAAKKQYKTYAEDCLKNVDQNIVAKFFNPCGDGTWYLVNMHEDEDYCWGFVVMNGYVESGSFSLNELKSVRLPYGLKIERDKSFRKMTCTELLNRLI